MNRTVLSFLAALLLAPAPLSAGPLDEVLARTPDDVQLALVLQNLRDHRAAWTKGPFAAVLEQSRLGQLLRQAPEIEKLRTVEKQVAEALGIDLRVLFDEVFGDAVMFAFHGDPTGKPEKEQGLIVSWVRDPMRAAAFLERLNELQIQSGELKEVRSQTHSGGRYVRRVKNDDADEFYYLSGSLLAFSSQEPMLHKSLELNRRRTTEATRIAKDLRKLGVAGDPAALWINVRAFDAQLEAKAKSAPANDVAILRTIQASWSALDAAALYLKAERNLEVGLAVEARPTDLPKEIRRFGSELAKAAALPGLHADDAIATAAVRIDLEALVAALAAFLSPAARKSFVDELEGQLKAVLDRDAVAHLPKLLGPEIGIVVRPPSDGPLPRVLAAVRLRDADSDAGLALREAVHTLATLARAKYNGDNETPIRVRTETHAGTAVRAFSHPSAFPVGVRPSYAFANGYFLLGSTPDAIADGLRGSAPTGPVPVARISFQRLDEYLKVHGPALTKALAGWNRVPEDEVATQLDKVRMLAEVVRQAELVVESDRPESARLSIRIEPVKPLK